LLDGKTGSDGRGWRLCAGVALTVDLRSGIRGGSGGGAMRDPSVADKDSALGLIGKWKLESIRGHMDCCDTRVGCPATSRHGRHLISLLVSM